MSRGPLFVFIRHRLFALLVLVLCGTAALAQADPPGRVGRLNHAEGTVSFSPAGDNEWTDAVLNRPLTGGDRLWTDRKSRAEIQIGSSAVRLDGQTHIDIMALDDRAAQLSLTQGTVYVRVRSLPEGENFEIDTPNLAYRAAYPGDYRIDVDPADGTTRVTIHSGTGMVYGEGGHMLPMGGGQQITFRARSLNQVTTQESPPQDAFDHWAAERNRREDQSISARYVPREVVGYQDLDAHGQWKKEPTYGAVWYPQGMPAGWAPYRLGHWEWIAPWGWNWIDDARWGFAPFHYGRWALVDSRWAWVPGRLSLRPIYAPALVAFVGGAGEGVLASVSSRTGVSWFPLAPGEMWQPGFHASAAYVSNVNLNMVPGASDAPYAYQRRAEALTAISGDDFQRGRPVGAGWLRVAAHTLTNAGIVPPPPMPERTKVAAPDKPAPAKAAPPAQSDVRQVVANAGAGAASSQREAVQGAQRAKAEQQARAAEQARAEEQARAAMEQAKVAEQARRAEQARQIRQAALEQAEATRQTQLAKQAGLEQQRKLAEQARLSEHARRAELGRADKLAQQSRAVRHAQRIEPAGRESVARTAPGRLERHAKRAESNKQASALRAEPTRREQARNTDRGRREQIAVRTEQARLQQPARREQQARRVELSRREAQAALRDERALAQARRSERLRREALARRDEQAQREAHAQRVEQARRAAERDAQALREQRLEREAQLRREANERELAAREQAQREAWQRQQQTSAEQYRRDQQAWEQQQQRERARARPDLRDEPRRPPEVWQRGTPILSPGRTS